MRSNQLNSAVNRIVVLVAFLCGVASLGACDGGNEGDRCNPDLSHNDCGAGLTCVTPSTCVENYCCPADPSTSSNNYCNGKSCPSADADTTAEDAAEDDTGTD